MPAQGALNLYGRDIPNSNFAVCSGSNKRFTVAAKI
jgi:hypothetical protein